MLNKLREKTQIHREFSNMGHANIHKKNMYEAVLKQNLK